MKKLHSRIPIVANDNNTRKGFQYKQTTRKGFYIYAGVVQW